MHGFYNCCYPVSGEKLGATDNRFVYTLHSTIQQFNSSTVQCQSIPSGHILPITPRPGFSYFLKSWLGVCFVESFNPSVKADGNCNLFSLSSLRHSPYGRCSPAPTSTLTDPVGAVLIGILHGAGLHSALLSAPNIAGTITGCIPQPTTPGHAN